MEKSDSQLANQVPFNFFLTGLIGAQATRWLALSTGSRAGARAQAPGQGGGCDGRSLRRTHQRGREPGQNSVGGATWWGGGGGTSSLHDLSVGYKEALFLDERGLLFFWLEGKSALFHSPG